MNQAAKNSTPAKSTPFPDGAEWLRADFHRQTRADREFKHDRGQVHNL